MFSETTAIFIQLISIISSFLCVRVISRRLYLEVYLRDRCDLYASPAHFRAFFFCPPIPRGKIAFCLSLPMIIFWSTSHSVPMVVDLYHMVRGYGVDELQLTSAPLARNGSSFVWADSTLQGRPAIRRDGAPDTCTCMLCMIYQ